MDEFFVGSLNCAAFMGGVIEAFLNGTQFVSAELLLLQCSITWFKQYIIASKLRGREI